MEEIQESKGGTRLNRHKHKEVFVEGAISPSFIADTIGRHSSKANIGAHSIFLGQVRSDVINGNNVQAIEYSTFREIAEEKLQEIRTDISQKHSLTCLHIYHSIGRVNSGEISLFVFASSGHRESAIAACAEVVERVKKETPVWGKEIFENETYQWKINR